MESFCNYFNYGYMTPFNVCFDIGSTTETVIRKYLLNNSTENCGINDVGSNGNGGIMRIAPIAFIGKFNKELIREVTQITHAHPISLIGSYIYIALLKSIEKCANKNDITNNTLKILKGHLNKEEMEVLEKHYYKIFDNNFTRIPEIEMISTGYVVTTLESALWCFLTTHTYKEAVLKAVNLRGDTDTIASITGAMAGLYYGYKKIPKEWIKNIQNKDLIDKHIKKFIKKYQKICD